MLKWLRAGAREGEQVRGRVWERCDDLMYSAAMKMGRVGEINRLLWSTEMPGETIASGEGEVGFVA